MALNETMATNFKGINWVRFEDLMARGAFNSFRHVHEFVKKRNGTLMNDHFQYKLPLSTEAEGAIF